MRIISQYFSDIDGIAVFPVIGIIVFFSFFLLLIWNIATLSRNYLNEMSNMPLNKDFEDSEETNNNKEIRHGEQ